MPSIYRTPKWYRRAYIPDWFRQAYRNGRAGARIAFKRFGLRKARPNFRRIVWKPFKRTVLYNEFRFIHRSLRHDFKKSGARTPGGWAPRFKAWFDVYRDRFLTGKAIFGDRGNFFQQRFTGFTSEESYQAGLPYHQTVAGYPDEAYSMSIEQAKAILDIPPEQYYPRIVDRQFAKIFMNNQVSRGGTYYILARVFCAKKVLDRDMRQLAIRDPPHLRPNVDIWGRSMKAAGRPDAPSPFNSTQHYDPAAPFQPGSGPKTPPPGYNGLGGTPQGPQAPRFFSTRATALSDCGTSSSRYHSSYHRNTPIHNINTSRYPNLSTGLRLSGQSPGSASTKSSLSKGSYITY